MDRRRSRFATYAYALLRKNITVQKRNLKTNIGIVTFPLLVCLLLAGLQSIAKKDEEPTNPCGCACASLTDGHKGCKTECGTQYPGVFELADTCPFPSPPRWPALLQIPHPMYRASCSGAAAPCPASVLVTGANRTLAQSVAANFLASTFKLNISDYLNTLADLVPGTDEPPAGMQLIESAFSSGRPLYVLRPECPPNFTFSIPFSILLSPSAAGTPLWIQYNQGNPNSVISWLERWTSSGVWKPLPQPKKTVDSKSQTKKSNYTMEIESGRSKRSVRRNSTASPDLGPANVTSEREKPKRNFKKISSTPDSVQEHPQTELEKVKRILRKVSNLTAEQPSDRPNAETVKLIHNLPTLSSSTSDIQDHGTEDSAKKLKQEDSEEKLKRDTVLTPDTKYDTVTIPEQVAVQELVDPVVDNQPPTQSNPLQCTDNEDNLPMVNEELNNNEERTSPENIKNSQRRASFSAKSECTDNGIQHTPTLPSYMATTESAKAKLRGQGSPRLGSDSVEKNGFTRRHSLPSSTNGKLRSHSPRTQRPVQASGKASARNDRSLLTSRDGNEKVIQVEWRR